MPHSRTIWNIKFIPHPFVWLGCRIYPVEEVDEEISEKGERMAESNHVDDPDAPPPKAKVKVPPGHLSETADLLSDSIFPTAYVSAFLCGKPKSKPPVSSNLLWVLSIGRRCILGNELVKAIKSRAGAWEGREIREDGRKDWEVLARLG